jgi:hypothetical protein
VTGKTPAFTESENLSAPREHVMQKKIELQLLLHIDYPPSAKADVIVVMQKENL